MYKHATSISAIECNDYSADHLDVMDVAVLSSRPRARQRERRRREEKYLGDDLSVANPLACYRHFNADDLVGPFLRKLLIYHVELAYFVILCQTVAHVNDVRETTESTLVAIWTWLWLFILFVHFLSLQFGVYLSWMYYDRLGWKFYVEFPIVGQQAMNSIGMYYFVVNVIAFSTLYSISILDIILFAVWNAFFFDAQVALRKLFAKTSAECDVMFEGLSVNLLLFSLLHFNGAHALLTTAIVALASYGMCQIHVHVKGHRPSFAVNFEIALWISCCLSCLKCFGLGAVLSLLL
jgi:hypothetical protein